MAKEAKEAQIKYIKTEELIPYVNNPRINDQAVDSVAASIKEFGFKQPIVIDKDKVVVAGHTRLKASKKLGLEEVPCIIADDLTEEQIKAYRLADNKVAESADWDLQKLELELKALEDVDMSQFGFEDMEKEAESFVELEEVETPDEVPERVSPGEIWKLGEHRLMCGDSTKKEDVEKLMDGELADLCVTDPPYNVALGYNLTKEEAKALHRRTDGLVIENDSWKNDEEFIKFITTAFDNLRDFLKVGGGVLYMVRSITDRELPRSNETESTRNQTVDYLG
jgi:site-specific DNA-methyltransferase (adenine-specific)